jgi:hypothetical protein
MRESFNKELIIFRRDADMSKIVEYGIKDLKLVNRFPDATDEEVKEAEWLLSKYFPGLVLGGSKGDEHTVIVGRELIGEPHLNYILILQGVGNPDLGQYADTAPTINVAVHSRDHAASTIAKYNGYYALGGGNFGGAAGELWQIRCPVDHGLLKSPVYMGRHSYNGNFNLPGDKHHGAGPNGRRKLTLHGIEGA